MNPSHPNDFDSALSKHNLNQYKGAFYNVKGGSNYQDPDTGAHFEYHDMCRRLERIRKEKCFSGNLLNDSELAEVDECEIPDEGFKSDHLSLYRSSPPKKLITTLLAESPYPTAIHTWTKESSQSVDIRFYHEKLRPDETPCNTLHTRASDQRCSVGYMINPAITIIKRPTMGPALIPPKVIPAECKHKLEMESTQVSRNAASIGGNYTCGNQNGAVMSPQRGDSIFKTTVKAEAKGR